MYYNFIPILLVNILMGVLYVTGLITKVMYKFLDKFGFDWVACMQHDICGKHLFAARIPLKIADE